MTATTETTDVVITEPGVYPGIPDATYHGDPVPEGSLSHSGGKKLLPPSAPALFKHERDHGRPPKKEFDFGHAAHALVLGVGAEIVVVEAEIWNTKAVKAQVEAIRAEGKVPLKPSAMAAVTAMAAALRQHPVAAALLAEGRGVAEASLFARDPATNVMLRGRLDHLPHPSDGRLIVTDYKSTVCAEPGAFGRSAAAYGYPSQHAWYVDLALALALADDVAMVFIAQEKEPPYLVSVVELEPEAVRAGRERNRRAIETYLRCRTEDRWPGYADEVALARVPRWYLYETEDVIA